MITIRPAFKAINSILGKQKYSEAIEYRWSLYCLVLKIEGGYLFYHTLTGELVRVDLFSLELNVFNRAEIIDLVAHWFLVPIDYEEKEISNETLTVFKMLLPVNRYINRYTVFTTTVCNARCFYCFELGQKRISMNDQTAVDVADWMISHSEGKKLYIKWFGGEPLCNFDAINSISSRLKDNDICFESSMISNGYLFNNELLAKAKSLWNLKYITITLDGTNDVYNKIKNYINDSNNAYKKVKKNIKALLTDGFAVTVRFNLDASNAEDLAVLSSELCDDFSTFKNFNVYCRFLVDIKNPAHHFSSNSEALKALKRINSILETGGIRLKRFLDDRPILNLCLADDSKSLTILPDGRIGKCELYGDSEEIGSIYSALDNKAIEAWKELWPENDRCNSCTCYPLCIRLKKCSYFNKECDELYRLQFIEDIKYKMKNSYESWIAQNK